MLLENSNTTNNNNNNNHSSPPHHKKGVMSSLFGHHHHHHHHNHHHHHHNHHHHSSSKSISPSHSLPSSSSATAEKKIEAVEAIITKWDPNSSTYTKITSLFRHSRKEAKEFVGSVKELRGAMNSLMSENYSSSSSSSNNKLVLAQRLMETAMKRLENELLSILSDNRAHLNPESISSSSSGSSSRTINNDDDDDDNNDDDEPRSSEEENDELTRIVNAVSEPVMSDLKSIADCMIVCGYGKEFIKIYKAIRTSVIDEAMFRLKIERFRSSHVSKMSWEALAGTVKTWLDAVAVAVKNVFNGEKILCDHVFSSTQDHAVIRDACFHDITKEAATNLFRLPELVAKVKKTSPEKIFRLMELYETFSELWPEIEAIFASDAASDVRSQALTSSLKLRDSIHAILPDFEATIHKDHSSKALVPGGGTHPMTRSVMDYISSLADHSGVLSGILADYPPPENLQKREYSFLENTTPANSPPPAADPISDHLAWLILVLLCKLDSRAEHYKDASLSYLFLANNLQFVIEKVKSTALKQILGDEWVSKHERKVQQYAASYESMAWAKVFFALPDPSFTAAAASPPPPPANDVFKQFGEAFEEEWRKQAAWIVQDGKLRDELKVSIAKKLVPKYREYYEANIGDLVRGGSAETTVVKFTPDDLANYLSDLFHGSSPSSGGLKLSSSSSSLLFPLKSLSL